jgi:hypothetical protein
LEGLATGATAGPQIEIREDEDEESRLLSSLSSPLPLGDKEDLLSVSGSMELSSSVSNMLTQILYLFFQGVLAGFSLTLPFLIYQVFPVCLSVSLLSASFCL